MSDVLLRVLMRSTLSALARSQVKMLKMQLRSYVAMLKHRYCGPLHSHALMHVGGRCCSTAPRLSFDEMALAGNMNNGCMCAAMCECTFERA
jgi:hypothetical protein